MPQCKERGEMLGNYIKVGGFSSRSIGLFCKQLPMFSPAIESKDVFTVGGRLTNLYKPAHHYNDITVEIEAVLLGLNINSVYSFFTNGDGRELWFSHIPDRYAIIRQLVAIDHQRIGNGALELKITLKCDPFKYANDNQPLTFLTSPADFIVGGNFYAEPVIVAKGCSDGFAMSINGNEFTTSGLTGNIYIDVPRRVAYQTGTPRTVVDNYTTGNIWDLILVPDEINGIEFSGATSIEITKNERWV